MSFSAESLLVARASPAAFGHVTSGGRYVPYPHLVLLDEHLTALCAGAFDRLIVSMPPRHGKSELVSRYFPAWYLGRFPDRRVMLASYEAAFAASWGRKARELVREFGEDVFGISLSRTSSASDAWEIAGQSGGMVTGGVGGALTGKGAHLLVIDDPVKNAEEANSELMRERAWDWWRSTARTRLQDKGAVVLVMTRWHEDDLAGRLLSQDAALAAEGERWVVLELPALPREDGADPLKRAAEEPLCPGLGFDERWAARTKASSGSYWWHALYQQSPRPPEGHLFKREHFRYWRREQAGEEELYVLDTDAGPKHFGASHCRVFQTVDPAATSKETSDWSVISTWAVTPDRDLILLERERARFEALDLGGFIKRSFERQRPFGIYVEAAGHALTLVQELSRAGLPIFRLNPNKDKISRALVAVARYEEHRVYHPRAAPWLEEWEEELLAFPQARYDDQVDTVAYAALELANLALTTYRQKDGGKTITGGLLDMEL